MSYDATKKEKKEEIININKSSRCTLSTYLVLEGPFFKMSSQIFFIQELTILRILKRYGDDKNI